MKKQLIILGSLTIIGSPWALAQNIEIIRTPLPPIQVQDEIKPTIDLSGVEEESTSNTNEIIVEENRTDVLRTYKYIKHVDLRDISKYDHQMAKKLPDSSDRLPGTSRKILQAITENPGRFAGADVSYYENGAKGPSGKSTFIKERGRKEFVISKRHPETQTNTIFSADYISAVEVAPSVIEAKILLFVHSDSQGYYFRKLNILVDWKKNKTHPLEDVVSVLSVEQDIPLASTDFKMKGSLSAQKVILEDQNSGITKVFPITVGAIDARSNSVESMTFWVPLGRRRAAKTEELKKEFQDFSNAALVKRSYWKNGFNTAERLYPSYYSGRPFIALIDMNYVTSEPNFSAGYREIGLHYQITSPNLERGFKSHGCIRVRDKDLYQLDAILNSGPKNKIETVFKKTLPQYEDINHPHTYKETYSKVAYTNFPSELEGTSIPCKYKGDDSFQTRSVRWNSENRAYHTIIDSDCLTKVFKTDLPATEVRDFWNNEPGSRVDVHIVNVEHGPVLKTRESLLTYNYHPATIDAMTHKQRLKTLHGVKNGTISVNTNNIGLDNNTLNSGTANNSGTNVFQKRSLLERIFEENIKPPKKSLELPSYGITSRTIGEKKYQKAKKKKQVKKQCLARAKRNKNKKKKCYLSPSEKRHYWVHLYYKNCIRDPGNQISIKSCPLIHKNIKKYLR